MLAKPGINLTEKNSKDAILVSEYSQQQEEDLRYQLSLNEVRQT